MIQILRKWKQNNLRIDTSNIDSNTLSFSTPINRGILFPLCKACNRAQIAMMKIAVMTMGGARANEWILKLR